jgi:DNA-binding LacI/PurR family transcriptional regulator
MKKEPDQTLSDKPSEQGRKQRVLTALRQSILDGTYPPGGQLPNQIELSSQFKVSGFTIHRALDQLAREGFIRKRQRVGTHVMDRPPHLNNLALLFPLDPTRETHYNKFYRALENALTAYERTEKRTIHRFHGVDNHTDTPDRLRLLTQVAAHQLAGIVFAHPPNKLKGTPIVDEPGLVRVAFSTTQPAPHIPAVTTDRYSFLDRALDYLVSRGRRRVALLLVPGYFSDDEHYLEQAMTKRGIQCPPHWQLTLSQSATEGAINCVRLLMHEAPSTRPDGLVITDDNLVEHAQAGLIAAGVRVPDEIEVVEHCNFPWPPSVLATKRLGFDTQAILRVCIDLIDRQRRGEPVPGITKVPAVFENELGQPAP